MSANPKPTKVSTEVELDKILIKAFNAYYDYITEKDIIKVAHEYSEKTAYKQAHSAITQLIDKAYLQGRIDEKIISPPYKGYYKVMGADKRIEAILRFYAFMNNRSYDEVVVEYLGKIPNPEQSEPSPIIVNRLYQAAHTAVAYMNENNPTHSITQLIDKAVVSARIDELQLQLDDSKNNPAHSWDYLEKRIAELTPKEQLK